MTRDSGHVNTCPEPPSILPSLSPSDEKTKDSGHVKTRPETPFFPPSLSNMKTRDSGHVNTCPEPPSSFQQEDSGHVETRLEAPSLPLPLSSLSFYTLETRLRVSRAFFLFFLFYTSGRIFAS